MSTRPPGWLLARERDDPAPPRTRIESPTPAAWLRLILLGLIFVVASGTVFAVDHGTAQAVRAWVALLLGIPLGLWLGAAGALGLYVSYRGMPAPTPWWGRSVLLFVPSATAQSTPRAGAGLQPYGPPTERYRTDAGRSRSTRGPWIAVVVGSVLFVGGVAASWVIGQARIRGADGSNPFHQPAAILAGVGAGVLVLGLRAMAGRRRRRR